MIDFELARLPKGASTEVILRELRRVTILLGKNTITTADLKEHGKISPHTVIRRFGNFDKALREAGLHKGKRNRYTDKEIITEIRHIADLLGKDTLTQEQFDKHSTGLKSGVAVRRFKSWNNSLGKAGLVGSRYYKSTDVDYFNNLEDIWIKLARQPKYSEVTKPFSRYSNGAYERHFGSWTKALLAFIEYKQKSPVKQIQQVTKYETVKEIINKHKTKREIGTRLRLKVLTRDSFRCMKCGRSPALDLGIILHVDHIIPYSKYGETLLENLQTLCNKCNLGKGDQVL